MKRFSILLLAFLTLEAFAQSNQAVEEINFNVALSHTEINNDSMSNWRTTTLSSGINFPLYDYLGSSVFIHSSRSGELQYSYDNYSYTTQTESYGGSAVLFLRNADIGKIGIIGGYSKTRQTTDINDDITTYTVKSTTTSHSYSLFGSYYLNDFTLGVSRGFSDLNDKHTFNYVDASIGYYFNENTSFDATISGMDSSNKFHLSFVHQPSLLQNSTIVGVSYANNDYDDSFTFFLSYHFQTKVSLRTRNREYR